MQLFNTIATLFLATSIVCQGGPPYVYITRDDGTKAQVGGSVGCFGTSGNIKEADITKGYKATFFTEYNCRGSQVGPYKDNVKFGYALAAKSVKIELDTKLQFII